MSSQADLDALLHGDDGLTKLEIELGDRMLLKVDAIEGFLKTDLVGMVDNHYLIVDMPKGGPAVKNKFFEGNMVLVRYLHKGAIFAFQSHVLGIVDKPIRLVFLSFPAIVSKQELRQEARIECYLNAAIDIGGTVLNGAVLDISPSGCRFGAKNPKKIKLENGQNIDIGVKLGEGEKARRIKGIIRSADNSGRMIMLGIQFIDIDDEVQFKINSLVEMLTEFADAKQQSSHLGNTN